MVAHQSQDDLLKSGAFELIRGSYLTVHTILVSPRSNEWLMVDACNRDIEVMEGNNIKRNTKP